MIKIKALKLTKVIVSTLIIVSTLVLNPIGASAHWKQDSNGWWNTEGNLWSVDWKYINEEWYYFDNNGYMKTGWILYGGKWYYLYSSGSMAENTTIDGYVIDSDGIWIQSNSKDHIQNSYKELDKLPQEYHSNEAQKNGDVVRTKGIYYNIEKLDKFIENYKNKKANLGDMVRVTIYGDEGGALICDLIIDSEGIKLMEDNTRDKYSTQKNKIITTYRVVDIYRIDTAGATYYVKTDQGKEKFLYSSTIH